MKTTPNSSMPSYSQQAMRRAKAGATKAEATEEEEGSKVDTPVKALTQGSIPLWAWGLL